MIASHDTFTFLPACKKWLEWFSFAWRTQTKDIYEQLSAGVEYFDIRVRRDNNKWRVCHGMVDLERVYPSLSYIARQFPYQYLRIILERGDEDDFLAEASELPATYENVRFIAIKRGWKVLYDMEDPIEDHCFTPFLSDLTTWQNIKHLWGLLRDNWRVCSIKGWSKSHPLSPDAKESDVIHFHDMI